MESKHGSPSKDENNSVNEDDALSPLISVGDSDYDSENEADVNNNLDEKTPVSVTESKHGSPSKDEKNSINEDDALSPLISIGDSDHDDSESEATVNFNLDKKRPVMESKHGSPSKDEKNSANENDTLSPLISVEDSDHDSESEAGVNINLDEKTPGSSKNSRSSRRASSSSSSSESSSDLLQMDAKMLKKSSTFPGGSPNADDRKSPNKKEKSDITADISSKSQDSDNTSPIDASSQVSHPSGKPTSQTMSPVPLPPKQVMERSGDYDPHRIPASVFGNRPSSAMEWSVASNDSLFSLSIGNNSFSNENFLMMSGETFGEDLQKSGEVYNSGELNKPGEANKSGQLPPLSPIGKLRKVRTMDADKKTEPTQLMDEDDSDQFEKKKHELDRNGNSSMINRPSDGSASSSHSFAFPVLADTTKYTSVKGPFPRKQDMKLDVYAESPQMKIHKKKSSSHWRWCCFCCYCCSLPESSSPSSRHYCWSWKWFKKWCCCCCFCDHCSSPQCSCPSCRHCWSWKRCKKWCCCCFYCCL